MGIQIDRLQIKKSAELIQSEIEGGGSPRGDSLVSLWKGLGHTVYYNNSDIQSGPTPYIYLKGSSWKVWQDRPSNALDFITETGVRLGHTMRVTERLEHEYNTAVAMISVSSGWFGRSRVYRGDAIREDMQVARFSALLCALAQVLKKEQF